MEKHEFNLKTTLNTKVVLLTHYGFNRNINNFWVVHQINIICWLQPQNLTVIQHWHLRSFNS